jgi:hypothetical protein|uniref:hypothetical protein n=1 Tax=Mesosutterella multiformis TaxID=2259133 RepID=UPI004025743B
MAAAVRNEISITFDKLSEAWRDRESSIPAVTLEESYCAANAFLHLLETAVSENPADELEKALIELDRLSSLAGVVGHSDHYTLPDRSESLPPCLYENLSTRTEYPKKAALWINSAIWKVLDRSVSSSGASEAKSDCVHALGWLAPERVPIEARPRALPPSIQALYECFPPRISDAAELLLSGPFEQAMPTCDARALRILEDFSPALWDEWPEDSEKAFRENERYFRAIAKRRWHQTIACRGETVSPFDIYVEAIGHQVKDPEKAAKQVFGALGNLYLMVSDDPAYFGRSLNCEAACKRIRQLADMTGNEETPASSKRTRKRKSTLLPFCFAKPDFAPASPAASAFADVLKELKLDDLPGYLDFVTGTVLVSIYRIPSSGSPAADADRAIQLIEFLQSKMGSGYPFYHVTPKVFVDSENKTFQKKKNTLLGRKQNDTRAKFCAAYAAALEGKTQNPALTAETAFLAVNTAIRLVTKDEDKSVDTLLEELKTLCGKIKAAFETP